MLRQQEHQNTNNKAWRYRIATICMLLIVMLQVPSFGQDENQQTVKPDDGKKPARAAFESAQLMEDQSVVVPKKKTLEFIMQHRFGTVENGISDLGGVYASSANIRLALSYSPISNLSLGFGATKLKNYIDFNAKYALLKQTKDWSMPVSVTLFGNTVMDTHGNSYAKSIYRMSYFAEIIIACRISPKLSLQVAPSVLHYNAVDSLYRNDMYAVTVSGRYKVSPQSSIMFNYMQQLTNHKDPKFKQQPGVTVGWEIATSSHAFQVFFTSLQGIVPQENISYNQLDFSKRQFLLGFNITRLWGF